MENIIKKHKEFLILSKIYTKDRIEIHIFEMPDFILKSSNETFGVEITEYYYNETSARLKNIEGYTRRILKSDSNKVLDKRDIDFLKKGKLYIKDEKVDKYIFLTDTIQLKYSNSYEWGELPKYIDFEKQIINIIESKNEKAKNYYKKGLDYLELFIDDREGYMKNHLEEINNSVEILNEVTKSNYKRVYIISENYLLVIGENPGENMIKYNLKKEAETN